MCDPEDDLNCTLSEGRRVLLMNEINLLTLDNFSTLVSDQHHQEKAAVILFSASWCQPCKNMKPIFQQVADEMDTQGILFGAVDIAQSPSLAQQYAIKSVPSIALFKRSELVTVIAGESTVSQLIAHLKHELKV